MDFQATSFKEPCRAQNHSFLILNIKLKIREECWAVIFVSFYFFNMSGYDIGYIELRLASRVRRPQGYPTHGWRPLLGKAKNKIPSPIIQIKSKKKGGKLISRSHVAEKK